LIETRSARIVNVSSGLHATGKLNGNIWDLSRRTEVRYNAYEKWQAYGDSKLANVLFTYELQRRLTALGPASGGVTAHVLHPGFIATDLGRSLNWIMRAAISVIGKSIPQGAATQILICSSPDVKEGAKVSKYWEDSKIVDTYNPEALDAELSKQLWTKTVELVQLVPSEDPFVALGFSEKAVLVPQPTPLPTKPAPDLIPKTSTTSGSASTPATVPTPSTTVTSSSTSGTTTAPAAATTTTTTSAGDPVKS